jgi:alkylation response protein AidB-like acyl-CoA dehydrogenase
MGARLYAMDAILYMTTGFLDRHDEDIMLETAMCKVFCSEMGYRVVDDTMQIMGGESYMTENGIERIWRDSRINIIVEGANEVMHSFIFAYGSKQLGEWMLSVRANPLKAMGSAVKIGSELFLGIRGGLPKSEMLHPRLRRFGLSTMMHIREHSHQVKMAFKEHEEKLITNQTVQARLSMCALWIHAMVCSISKLDRALRNGLEGNALEHDMAMVEHLVAMANLEIQAEIRSLHNNTDSTMKRAAAAAMLRSDLLPNSAYTIPERTMDLKARGSGQKVNQSSIPQFGSGSVFDGVKVGK